MVNTEIVFPDQWAIPAELDGSFFFHKFCSYLKSYTALDLVINWTPDFDIKKLEFKQDLLTAAQDLINQGLLFPFSKSPQDSLELLQNRFPRVSQDQLVNWGRDLVYYLRFFFEIPETNLLKAQLYDPDPAIQDLAKSFEWVFGEGSEVMDRASHELRDIRRKIKSQKTSIEKLAEELIRDPRYRPMLQEPIHVNHIGRKVLLWKSDFSGHAEGMRHGRSKSGQSTYFEPTSLMQANNFFIDLIDREAKEVARITTELLMRTMQQSSDLLKVIDSLKFLDFYQAKVKYVNDLQHSCRPQLGAKDFEIVRMVHPALESPVAQNFTLNPPNKIVILSGPNAGGKTVCMKTVGIVVMHAILGLRVPAEYCSLPEFSKILINLGDQQSLSDSLSSFSARLKQWRRIFKKMDSDSLILVDEIMSATDPREGEILAREICSFLENRGVYAIVTTHFGDLKQLANESNSFENASMVFDEKTLQPTFELIMGTPGNSYALELAVRLNLPRSIVNKARKKLGKDYLELTKVLRVQKQRQLRLSELIQNSEKLSELISRLIKAGKAVLKDFEVEKDRLIQKDLRKSRERVHKAIKVSKEKSSEDRIQQVGSSRNSRKARKSQDQTIVSYQQNLRKIQQEILQKQSQLSFSDMLQKGDSVRVIGYNGKAIVERVDPKKMEALVRLGSVKLQVGLEDIEKLDDNGAGNRLSKSASTRFDVHNEPSNFLDLRGSSPDEALFGLEYFLDQALIHGVGRLEIITGRGVLRDIVLDHLDKDKSARWKHYWSLKVETGCLIFDDIRSL